MIYDYVTALFLCAYICALILSLQGGTFCFNNHMCPPLALPRYRRYLYYEALVVSAQLVPLNLARHHL